MTLEVEPERVKVAHPAVKDVFRAEGPAADLGGPYVLTVATLEPRKNLQTLVDAHRLLGGDLLLAVVGAEGWGEQPFLDGQRVRRLGFVSDDELARLYRGAAVAVYPSRFEGFGIPVIEAMACGCPVVSSAHPSLDEASGEAPCAPIPTTRPRSPRRSRIALGDRERLSLAGLEPQGFTWRGVGERSSSAPSRRRWRSEEAGGRLIVVHRAGVGRTEFLVLERAPDRQGYWHVVAGALEEGESAPAAAGVSCSRRRASRAPVEAARRRLRIALADEPPEVRARFEPDVTRSDDPRVRGRSVTAGWEPELDEEHVGYRWLLRDEAVELLEYEEPRDAVRETARRLGAAA